MELTDAHLVACAQEDEWWAREALAVRYLPMALRVAGRLLPSAAEREDVAQSAFLKAFSQLQRLRDGQLFAGWLKQIVVRTALNRIRRRRLETTLGLHRREAPDLTQIAGSGVSPERRADLVAVYRALETVKPIEKTTFILRVIEEMTVPEIAEVTGAGPSTVKRRLHRVQEVLARLNAGRSLHLRPVKGVGHG